ncbi:leucine-rich repeat-containing protein 15-like [Sitodiplosis mosellana]|uniref:leucine-rich repeat-containing protein 15-like n=1 Tax=Sitodiplosis mosellana TaxID=263140 RepID=UPI0024440689|nr:leucine-rich repeat-containing protein 15-like [Sitodiplosis mosellana]
MKIKLVSFAFALWATQVYSIENIANPSKYHHIGACYYYDHPKYGRSHLTLVCVKSYGQYNFFTSNVSSICLNHQQLNSQGYRKTWVGSMNFDQVCERPELPNNLFKVYSNLDTFNMSYLGLTSLPVNMFWHAAKLIRLNVSHNQLEEIPSFLFHKTVKLTEVDFSFNKINTIDDFAFAGDFNLEKMYLSHNKLNDLNEKIFKYLSHLKHFDICGNNLVEIKPGLFSSLTKLQTLNLAFNRLKTLNANSLPTHLNQMKSLSFENNQLQEFIGFNSAHIGKMKIIGIDSNRFNCSYLHTLLQLISWKNLDTISNRINCSNVESTTTEANELSTTTIRPTTISTSTAAPILSTPKPTLKSTNTENVTTTFDPNGEKTLEEIHQSTEENGSIDSRDQKFDAKHEKSHKFIFIALLINTTALIVIIVVLFSYCLCKNTLRRSHFTQVVYEPNTADLRNYFENKDYEEIFPKHLHSKCDDAMFY